MKTIEVIIMNAFARDSGGGNPAAIVTNADGLTNPEKQAISKKLGLSETAFVSHSSVADYKLEFFTPTKQIAHCGHATIAAFSYLRESGVIKKDILTNETTDGLREIRFINGRAFMEQKSPAFSYPSDADADTILRSVNIKSDDLPVGTRPVIVNTGNSFLLIEVRSERALMHAKPHLDLISRVSEAYGLIGFYMFYRDSSGSSHATTRMFAPLYGIEEEAATVMAAGPLACLLYRESRQKEIFYFIEQGKFMNPPSPSAIEIILDIKSKEISRLYVGGSVYKSKVLEIQID